MRAVISTLMVVCLLAVIGCDSNDENTLNPIPKSHYLNPCFTVKAEAPGGDVYGICGALLDVNPSIGWEEPIATNENGFVSTLSAGTLINYLDSTVLYPGTDSETIVVDTHLTVTRFNPGQTYTFMISLEQPFFWDSTSAILATSIDSLWSVWHANTERVSVLPDLAVPPDTVIDSVAVTANPYVNVPDSSFYQLSWYGTREDSIFVLLHVTNDTLLDSMRIDAELWNFWRANTDAIYLDSVDWGFWYRIDTTFYPSDSSYWCDLEIHVDSADTYWSGDIIIWIDTLGMSMAYSNCSPYADPESSQVINRPDYHWTYDTTAEYIVYAMNEGLLFSNDLLRIYSYGDTLPVSLYWINDATHDTTEFFDNQFQITMPASDTIEQPDYEVFIKPE